PGASRSPGGASESRRTARRSRSGSRPPRPRPGRSVGPVSLGSMTPAKKRPRAYAHLRTRAAVLAQYAHVRDAVRSLATDQLARPTRLGDWAVHDLVAHIAQGLGSVSRDLALPEPPGPKPATTLLEWPPAVAAFVRDPEAPAPAAARPDLL